jgi:hypothetical protein
LAEKNKRVAKARAPAWGAAIVAPMPRRGTMGETAADGAGAGLIGETIVLLVVACH